MRKSRLRQQVTQQAECDPGLTPGSLTLNPSLLLSQARGMQATSVWRELGQFLTTCCGPWASCFTCSWTQKTSCDWLWISFIIWLRVWSTQQLPQTNLKKLCSWNLSSGSFDIESLPETVQTQEISSIHPLCSLSLHFIHAHIFEAALGGRKLPIWYTSSHTRENWERLACSHPLL